MFSDNIKILRLSRGLTQQEVASAICVSQGTIYFWENNINKPSSIYLSKLANLFNMSISELLDEDDALQVDTEAPKRQSTYHELVNLYSKLNSSQQGVIISVMRELVRAAGKKIDGIDGTELDED